jgi:SAM-dependent methyltransferase
MKTTPHITYTADGRAYLHIWRTGRSYAQQKGALYRREWTNVLFSMVPQPADEPDIFHHDVRKSLPFADKTFEAAYALHVIEHLTPAEARSFVNELYRVLKPAGIVRISTPDLEDICRSYLRQLDECRTNRSDLNMVRYRWAVLELLDQIVRDQSGGLMSQSCARGDFDPEFGRIRFGDVFDEFAPPGSEDARSPRARPLMTRLTALTYSSLISGMRRRVLGAVDRCCGTHMRSLRNDPRCTGELNRWMYDELSLEMLLEAEGFRECRRQDHRSSMIPGWDRYALDQSTAGSHAIEPSLYFEARKPSWAALRR